METAIYDFIIRKGASVRENFSISDISGNPIDLTGWTIKSQIREAKSSDSDLIAEFIIEFINPSTGSFSLILPYERTAAIAQNKGFYDILFENPSGSRSFYCEGTIKFIPSMTL